MWLMQPCGDCGLRKFDRCKCDTNPFKNEEETEDMARQKVETGQSNIWKFESEGDTHKGVYSGTRTLDPQYKPLFIVGDKLVKPTAQVEQAFENIKIGAYVWLTFQGKKAIKGGKTVNVFDIEQDPDYKAPLGDKKEAF